MSERIRRLLDDLRLAGMREAFDQQALSHAFASLGFDDRLENLLVGEQGHRLDRQRARLFSMAKLRYRAHPQDIKFHPDRELDRTLMANLITCNWIENSENALITGPTGSGKSWLACALAVAAIHRGLSVKYLRTNPALEEMMLAHGDGSIGRLRASWAKVALLILDDFGIAAITDSAKEDLFELLEARHDRGSTIIVGQLATHDWHGYLDSPLLADAILDRMMQRSHRIKLSGASMRSRRPSLPEDG